MRLRQVVLVARELEPVVEEICRELQVEVCYRDPGVGHFGLHNAVMPVGDTFLEVVSPVREGTAAGRYLERGGGDGGYMALLQVDDLAAARERLDRLGVRVVWEGQGDGIRALHAHPADVGGAILSFDCARPPDSWGWAGPRWRSHLRTDRCSEIVALEVRCEDPAVLAQRWAEVLDGRAEPAPEGANWVIPLERGSVRLVMAGDGRGARIGGFDVVAVDRAQAGRDLVLGGVRVRLI